MKPHGAASLFQQRMIPVLQLKDVPVDAKFVCLSLDQWGPVGVVKYSQHLAEVQFYLRESRTILQRGPIDGRAWVEVPRKLRNKGRMCRV